MRKLLLFLVALVLLLACWHYLTDRSNLKLSASRESAVAPPTMISVDTQAFSSANKPHDRLVEKVSDRPPDVLTGTNLEQLKSLIKDLKQQEAPLTDYWSTARFRAGNPPVLLKYNGQSIIYRAQYIEAIIGFQTTNLWGTSLYSPCMNINETRELGLKLCSMFGFDSNEFRTWCDSVGNNWSGAPIFNTENSKISTGDQSHSLSVLKCYDNKQPWFMILTFEQKSTSWYKLP